MLHILPSILLGLILGWMVNYLADVLPTWRRLTRPQCVQCGEQQRLMRYFLWPRRCRSCGYSRRWRYWSVEIILMFTTAQMWLSPPSRLGFLAGALLLFFFALVVVIDLEHRLILHPVSLVGSFLGFGVGIWLHGLLDTLLGGVVGFGLMLLLYYFGGFYLHFTARRRGVETDEVALGFGDVNLAGILGLILGWPVILVALFLAVVAGGVTSLFYLVGMIVTRRYRSFAALPYAPFLITGAALILYFPETARRILLTISPIFSTVNIR